MEKINHEKRLEILKAAVDLFSKRGFEKTTVDEIAAHANVGKGTIYLYFANKEKIFVAIIESGIQEILRRMNEIFSESTNFRQQLGELLKEHLQFAENHRDFYQVLINERLNMKWVGDKESQDRLIELHHKLNQQLTKFMQIGIDQGQIRNGDPSIFAYIFTGIISQFCFHWLTEKENESLVEQVPVIFDLFFNGVGKKE